MTLRLLIAEDSPDVAEWRWGPEAAASHRR